MSRSLHKGFYINGDIKRVLKLERLGIKVNSVTTMDRSSTIVPQLTGKKVLLYNGRAYHPIYVSSDMIGHKFGEFVSTRKKAIYKRKRRR